MSSKYLFFSDMMTNMIFSFLVSFLLLLFSPAGLAGDTAYPVQWTPEIKLKALADIPQLLTSNSYVGTEVDYVNFAGQSAVAKNCNEYFALTKHNYYPKNNMEIAAESFFKNNCDPLLALQRAIPPKVSYIRDFNIQRDYGLLPAGLIFPNLGEGAQPSGNLKTAFPDLKVENNLSLPQKTSITLTSKTADERSIISVLGWGDFNHDGYDDMLIFIGNYVLDGTYHVYSTYIVTRKGKDAAIEQV